MFFLFFFFACFGRRVRFRFVRFANMLINDSIFHMDDAMKKLTTIKAAQVVKSWIMTKYVVFSCAPFLSWLLLVTAYEKGRERNLCF